MKTFRSIMAVLWAASAGIVCPRAPAFAAVADPAGAAVAVEDKNPVNALAKILRDNGGARADAGRRIEDFLLKPDAARKSFVAAGTDAAALGAVAREWAKLTDPGQVAVLYFVIGPGGEAPSWAAGDSVLDRTFKSGMKWEGRLREALAGWTGKSQIVKTAEKVSGTAFLNDAAQKASAVFADPRTRTEIDESAARHDRPIPVPTTGRVARGGLRADAQRYTIKELYEMGGVVGEKIYAKGDKDAQRISMKIYTTREKGVLVNKIGLYDITDPNKVFGSQFSLLPGEQSFSLNGGAGFKTYTLKVETDPATKELKVFFGQAGTKPNQPGTINTTVEELFRRRADEAQELGNIVNVGGTDYYVLPQGGARGAAAFFEKDKVDHRAEGRPRELRPDLYAEIGVRDAEGRTVNVPYTVGPHLGKAGGKEYHLEFNEKDGLWEVKDGAGDPPEEPKAAGDAGASGAEGGASGGGSAGGAAESVEERVKKLLAADTGCNIPADAGKLRNDLAGKYGVILCKDKGGTPHLQVVVPKEFGEQLEYTDAALLGGRFYDHYLILRFKDTQEYLDLLQHAKNGATGFLSSGTVDLKAKSAGGFSDAAALVDALKGMGLSESAGAAIIQRVKNYTGSKTYTIAGGGKDMVVTVVMDNKSHQVWPEEKDASSPGASDPYAGVSGPSTAFDGVVKAEDEEFQDTLLLDAAHEVTLIKKKKDVALYKSKDAASPAKYYLTFKFRVAEDGKDRVVRAKPFELFSEEEGKRPLPARYEMAGLAAAAPVVDVNAMGYTFVSGSSETRGVLAVYKNAQIQPNWVKEKGANCVAPIFWWGVDRAAAGAACKKNQFKP